MTRMLYITLPVADVEIAAAFYQAIGFALDKAMTTGPDAAMMRWSDGVAFMLVSHAKFGELAPKPLADSQATSAALFALACASRTDVDAMTAQAVAAGGREGHEPEDLGFMYSRAFSDPDGHGFGPMWMDADAMSKAMATPPTA